jgi:hypothetical protein
MLLNYYLAAPLLIESFPMVQRTQGGVRWFGRSKHDKQNNLPSILDRFDKEHCVVWGYKN